MNDIYSYRLLDVGFIGDLCDVSFPYVTLAVRLCGEGKVTELARVRTDSSVSALVPARIRTWALTVVSDRIK